MQFADPLRIPLTEKDHVAFAAVQWPQAGPTQQDFFLNFNDECFVLTDGVSGTPHAEIASSLAAETAVWGYTHIRQRPFYWGDKLKLLKRIFRSTNLTLWQKRRETGFEGGLATTMLVCIVTPKHVFVGNVGDTEALLYRNGLIDTLSHQERDREGTLTRWLGSQRLGLIPYAHMEKFLPGDIVLLATDGLLDFVSEEELRSVFEMIEKADMTLTTAAESLVKQALENGSKENQTVCLVQKIS